MLSNNIGDVVKPEKFVVVNCPLNQDFRQPFTAVPFDGRSGTTAVFLPLQFTHRYFQCFLSLRFFNFFFFFFFLNLFLPENINLVA